MSRHARAPKPDCDECLTRHPLRDFLASSPLGNRRAADLQRIADLEAEVERQGHVIAEQADRLARPGPSWP